MPALREDSKLLGIALDTMELNKSLEVKTISDVLGETFVDLFSEIKNYFSPSEATTTEPGAQEYYIPEKNKMDDLNIQLQEYFSPSNPIRMEYYIEDPDVYKQRIKKEGQPTTEQPTTEQPPVEVEGINTQVLRGSLDPDQQTILETNNQQPQPRTNAQNRDAQEYLGVAADGIWGNISKRSLVKWQSKNGLPISEELNDETLAAMKDPNFLDSRKESTRKSVLNEAGTAPDLAKVKTWAKENISDPIKAAAFVATVEAETGGRNLVEIPYLYSSVKGSNRTPAELAVHPTLVQGRFRVARAAAFNALATDPDWIAADDATKNDMIFDIYYDDQYRDTSSKLGNTQVGDGSRFKGRGLIQLTGRSNYEAIGKILGIDLISNPELVNDPKYAAPVAMAYLTSKAGSSSSTRNDFFIGDLTRNKLRRIVGHDNTIQTGETLTPAQIRWNRTEQLEDEMYP